MSSFTENLIVSPLKNGRNWVVRKEFFYDVGFEGSGDTIVVSCGFVTDFTTVPRFLWSIFPKWEKYGNAAIIHDYLYFSHERTREEADKIFYEGMIVLGVSKLKAQILYNAVRIFGKDKYKNSRAYMIEMLDEKIEISKMEKL